MLLLQLASVKSFSVSCIRDFFNVLSFSFTNVASPIARLQKERTLVLDFEIFAYKWLKIDARKKINCWSSPLLFD